jgi:hypothetical protein
MPARRMPARKRNRSCLKVIAPALEQRIVGISHGFGLAASDHDLEIDRLQTVVLIAMDDPRRAGNAFPGAEPARDLAAVFILDKDVEMALQDKEDFFDFMGVRGMMDSVKLPAGIDDVSPCFPEPPAPMKRCCARLKPSIFASSNAAQSALRSAKRAT